MTRISPILTKLSNPLQTLEALQFLEQLEELDLAILFGSMASGQATRESDLDLAIYPNRTLSPAELNQLSDQLALTSDRPVDLVDLTRVNGTLLRQILRHGKVIFIRNPEVLGILSERLLDWQADFEPAYQAILASQRQRFISSAHG